MHTAYTGNTVRGTYITVCIRNVIIMYTYSIGVCTYMLFLQVILFNFQVEYFQSERRKQITNMVDIIVEGKRRKLMGLSTKKKGKKAKLSKDSEV